MSNVDLEQLGMIAIVLIAFPFIIWDVRRRWRKSDVDWSAGEGGE